jgi:hypothetical protein
MRFRKSSHGEMKQSMLKISTTWPDGAKIERIYL